MARQSLAGKPLVDASYRLLWQDKEMVPLLFAGSVASALAFALIAGIGALLDPGALGGGGSGAVGYVFFAVALLVATSLSTFFLGAIVAAATQRAEGLDPTASTALAAAWERRVPLFAWALTSTVVGLVIRQLERFGPVGAVLRLAGGLAWGVATIFAVPVVMAEGTMPLASVRRSSQILSARFGSNVRAGFRLGFQWVAAALGAVLVAFIGVLMVVAGSTTGSTSAVLVVLGVLVALAGVLGVFVVSAIYSAVGAYLRTVLYRYATGLPTPGIDPALLPPTVA